MTSSNPDGASVRASSAISAKVGGTTTMRGRGMGEVNAESAIGVVSAVAEYYIEIGKPSSAPLGAMGDRLCKGLEAANNVNTGPSVGTRLADVEQALSWASARNRPCGPSGIRCHHGCLLLGPPVNAAMRFYTNFDDPGPRYPASRAAAPAASGHAAATPPRLL